MPAPTDATSAEQPVVASMYARLDVLTTRAERDLARVRRAQTAGTPAARVEREAMIRAMAERLASLVAAERRLCFGRLDYSAGGSPLYIGRLSMADEDQRLLLSDWRAPAAEPFYRATSADPMGIARRRHLLLDGRALRAVEDDLLDLDAVADDVGYEGTGALMAALAARRTGRMGDIVATIQAEQDRIIRAPLPGVLVVEGGPGCGKTVVGLHRAAYLLYTHRDRIARSGVLVVGPNPLFLRYISQVLPGLGEASAVLSTPGQLFPGIDAQPEGEDAVAAIKGDVRMADVVARAIANRQRVPRVTRRLDVVGTPISLTPAMASAARDRARASRKPHNRARLTFVLALLDRLAQALAAARGVDPDSHRDVLIADLRDCADVRREVNLCWMPLTPQQVVADLWADPEALAAAAPRLSRVERAKLARGHGSAWTVSDVPLLDEAAELLGEDAEPARRAAAVAASERAVEEEYARSVIEMTGVSGVSGLTAQSLIDRYAGSAPERRSVADAALTDRTWVFGHVVVDEAQELSPMHWRLLMRRCPSRSMTVVGDLAQAGSAAAPRTWDEVFDRMAPGRWSVARLSVNYRTPEPIMHMASEVLVAAGGRTDPPRSARDGESPRLVAVAPGRSGALATAVAHELAGWTPGDGRAAVIAAPQFVPAIAERLRSRPIVGGSVGVGSAALDTMISVLTVAESKGLEFDCVVIVEPAAILAASARGGHDLYVALTRATRTLVVVHSDPLPEGFGGATTV